MRRQGAENKISKDSRIEFYGEVEKGRHAYVLTESHFVLVSRKTNMVKKIAEITELVNNASYKKPYIYINIKKKDKPERVVKMYMENVKEANDLINATNELLDKIAWKNK